MTRLKGKVAVVTGASKGIGASIAEHLAAEGASVVVNYAASKTGADSVVRRISDRVAVMYVGQIVELAETRKLFAQPLHPYTSVLLKAIPLPDPDAKLPEAVPIGEPPSPFAPPSGCRFRTRCPRATAHCAAEEPPMRKLAPGRFAACHFPLIEPA